MRLLFAFFEDLSQSFLSSEFHFAFHLFNVLGVKNLHFVVDVNRLVVHHVGNQLFVQVGIEFLQLLERNCVNSLKILASKDFYFLSPVHAFSDVQNFLFIISLPLLIALALELIIVNRRYSLHD